MLGGSSLVRAGNSPSANRVFLYEVKGLRQSDESDKNSYPVRRSGSVFIRVPYARMNEEMLRISRLGGEIVNIKPIGSEETAEASEE